MDTSYNLLKSIIETNVSSVSGLISVSLTIPTLGYGIKSDRNVLQNIELTSLLLKSILSNLSFN